MVRIKPVNNKHGDNFIRGHYRKMMKIYLSLTVIRYTLFPRLMSGELAIAELCNSPLWRGGA